MIRWDWGQNVHLTRLSIIIGRQLVTFYERSMSPVPRPAIQIRHSNSMSNRSKYYLLALFAAAMALLEAAVVVYMRRLYYPENPLDIFPLDFLSVYDPRLELAREASTIVMLIVVALLAGHTTWTRKFAAFVFVFGFWDLLYYAWLKVLIGWPRNWHEWDVLFLIPTIWLGPWICPALIALLFTIWGSAILLGCERRAMPAWSVWTFTAGSTAGLITFMQPAIAVWLNGGGEALIEFRPNGFWWWLYIPAFALMSVGLWSCFLRSGKLCSKT